MNHLLQIKETEITKLFDIEIPQIKRLKGLKRLDAIPNLDMLHLNLDVLSWDFLEDLDYLPIFTGSDKTNGKRYRIYIGNQEFFFTIINYCYNKNPTSQLQINPKNFYSSALLFELIELISGEELTEDNHKPTRCDPSFTILESIASTSLVAATANFKWKRKTTKFFMQARDFDGGEETGYRTNSRGTNYSAYSQAAKRITKKEASTGDDIAKTRLEFELRTYDLKKLKIHTVFDLYKLRRKKVFSKMDFYDPTIGKIKSQIDYKKFSEFQIKVFRIGFHQSRMHFNRKPNRNFHKKYAPLLVPLTINNGKVKVKTCLRRRFIEWLDNWWVEDYVSIFNDGRKTLFNKFPISSIEQQESDDF